MWAQALVIHSSKKPLKIVTNKPIRSRVKATRVEMRAMKKKRKTRLKLLQILIHRISARCQSQRK